MSRLELLWIPAVLGWIPLIYAGELSALVDRLRNRHGQPPNRLDDAVATGQAEDPIG